MRSIQAVDLLGGREMAFAAPAESFTVLWMRRTLCTISALPGVLTHCVLHPHRKHSAQICLDEYIHYFNAYMHPTAASDPRKSRQDFHAVGSVFGSKDLIERIHS